MISALVTMNDRNAPFGKITRYIGGDHDLPYMPNGAKEEFRSLARKSVTNWLPLIVDTYAKSLFVDGYRPARSAENARPWEYWQANGMDARQTVAIRGALAYGTSYVLVLPGEETPLIRPLNPTKTLALYDDDDDDWPAIAIQRVGKERGNPKVMLYRVYDEGGVYTVRSEHGSGNVKVAFEEEHGLGVVPMIRFRERLEEDVTGIVAPLITTQDRVNEIVFTTSIALQYASFRQRWATGMAIPLDEREEIDGKTNPNFGKPIEAFEAAVNRLWLTDNPEARFGDFAQTEVHGHLSAYQGAVKTLAAQAQTSPLVLLGDLANLSAEALAAIESTTQRKIGEYETIFGEAWEQTLRLAAAAAGDFEAASDAEAQVRWRDTEARSLAATVDALGKMVTMLGLPAEAAWERIPGTTDQDVQRWKAMRSEGDVFGALMNDFSRQAAPVEE
jgi:hypothetical protein